MCLTTRDSPVLTPAGDFPSVHTLSAHRAKKAARLFVAVLQCANTTVINSFIHKTLIYDRAVYWCLQRSLQQILGNLSTRGL